MHTLSSLIITIAIMNLDWEGHHHDHDVWRTCVSLSDQRVEKVLPLWRFIEIVRRIT